MCLEHIEKWGLWDDQLKRARLATSDPHILAQIDVAPHWSVVGGHGRRRVEERMRQEAVMGTSLPPDVGSSVPPHVSNSTVPPHFEVENDLLHEMVEDLLAREVDAECEDDCACIDAAQKEEDHLLQAAKSPLYEGCKYSILRASLEILNLQAMFGWSSASVDALLR